jgi:hypothetical protein
MKLEARWGTGQSGLVRKISPPPGFEPRTVASRYTDWAVPAPVITITTLIWLWSLLCICYNNRYCIHKCPPPPHTHFSNVSYIVERNQVLHPYEVHCVSSAFRLFTVLNYFAVLLVCAPSDTQSVSRDVWLHTRSSHSLNREWRVRVTGHFRCKRDRVSSVLVSYLCSTF